MNSGQDKAGAEFLYDVFISYRHGGDDQKIAEELHKRLETFRTPKVLVASGTPARLKRVFRDRDELPVSSDLNVNILDALKQSNYLVVICSPRTPQSRWIREEIKIFQALGRGGHIMPLLIEGEPKESFPLGLIEKHIETVTAPDGKQTQIEREKEPIAADIRAETHAQRLKLLKTETLRLLAPILGCKFDDLRQREQERARRRLIAASLVLGVSALVFAGLSVFAGIQYFAAKRNEAIAKEQRSAAVSGQSKIMARLANDVADRGDVVTALHLALEALLGKGYYENPPVVSEAVYSLYRSLSANRVTKSFRVEKKKATNALINPQGDHVAVFLDDETVQWHSADTGARVDARAFRRNAKEILAVAFADEEIAVGLTGGRLQIFDEKGETLKAEINIGCAIRKIHFRSGGDRALVECEGPEQYEIQSAVWVNIPEKRTQQLRLDANFAVAPNRSIIASERKGIISIYDFTTGKPRRPILFKSNPLHDNIVRVAINADGTRVAVAHVQDVLIFDVVTGALKDKFRATSFRQEGIAFNLAGGTDHGDFLITHGDNGQVSIWAHGPVTEEIVPIKTFEMKTGSARFVGGSLFVTRTADSEEATEEDHKVTLFSYYDAGFLEATKFRLRAGAELLLSERTKEKIALVAAAQIDGRVDIVALPKPLSEPKTIRIGQRRLSANGKLAAVVLPDRNELVVVDLSTMLSKSGIKVVHGVVGHLESFAVSDTGELAIAWKDGIVEFREIRDGSVVPIETKTPRMRSNVEFGEVGPTIAVLSSPTQVDLISLRNGTVLRSFINVPAGIAALGIADNAKIVVAVTGTDAFFARLNDPKDAIFEKVPWPIECTTRGAELRVRSSGKFIVVSSGENVKWIFDPETRTIPFRDCMSIGEIWMHGSRIFRIYREKLTIIDPKTGTSFGQFAVSDERLVIIVPQALETSDRQKGNSFHEGNGIVIRQETLTEVLPLALKSALECLSIAQRRQIGLDPMPPAYCIEGERYPFAAPAWKTWLEAKRRGETPPLPE